MPVCHPPRPESQRLLVVKTTAHTKVLIVLLAPRLPRLPVPRNFCSSEPHDLTRDFGLASIPDHVCSYLENMGTEFGRKGRPSSELSVAPIDCHGWPRLRPSRQTFIRKGDLIGHLGRAGSFSVTNQLGFNQR